MPRVELIFATLEDQEIMSIDAGDGATIQTCIDQSGVLLKFPEIDLASMKVGIFSQVKPLDYLVQEGDRIEIYRPLIADPKVVRRKKAEDAKK